MGEESFWTFFLFLLHNLLVLVLSPVLSIGSAWRFSEVNLYQADPKRWCKEALFQFVVIQSWLLFYALSLDGATVRIWRFDMERKRRQELPDSSVMIRISFRISHRFGLVVLSAKVSHHSIKRCATDAGGRAPPEMSLSSCLVALKHTCHASESWKIESPRHVWSHVQTDDRHMCEQKSLPFESSVLGCNGATFMSLVDQFLRLCVGLLVLLMGLLGLGLSLCCKRNK